MVNSMTHPDDQLDQVVARGQCGAAGCRCARPGARGDWLLHCPAHADRRPSFHAEVRGERLLVCCLAGCEQPRVLDALRAAGAWGAPSPALAALGRPLPAGEARRSGAAAQRPSPSGRGAGGEGVLPSPSGRGAGGEEGGDRGWLAARWDVRDAAGRLVAWHERWDTAAGAKRFVWRRPGRPAAGLHGLRAAALPLHGAERLAAWPADAPLLLCEGEKAANAAQRLGAHALGTVTGAAGLPDREALAALAGRDVVLWPDADPPGARHMARLGGRLAGLNARVRLLDWPAAPPGGDAADFAAAGGTAEALAALVAAAPPLPTPAAGGAGGGVGESGRQGGGQAATYTELGGLGGLGGLTALLAAGGSLVREPPQAKVRCLADVQPRRLRWLWPGYLPLGKLVVLDGDPGLGKSLLTLDLAARLSRALPMPDGSRGVLDAPAAVLLIADEDDAGDTIRPRLDAAGADVSRVHLLKEVVDGALRRPLSLPRDAVLLAHAIGQHRARLIVIDPLMAYLEPGVDAHRDAPMRRALRPLAQMAARLELTVLVVRHLNKSTEGPALYRGGGTIGIIGAARGGLLVARDPADPSERRRVLVPSKANLSEKPRGLIYTVEEHPDLGVGRVVWQGAVDLSADALLAGAEARAEQGALNEAVAWLRQELADQPRPMRELRAAAAEAGISLRSLERAKLSVGIRARQVHAPERCWLWELPDGGPSD